MTLDLKALEKQLDEFLENETKESLNAWLDEKRGIEILADHTHDFYTCGHPWKRCVICGQLIPA